MSHAPQRKEKNCLNCGTIVQGKYCQNCGQANVEPKESFWHMLSHFFNDITHFDGSFFTTAKDLFFKPGFLSKEYMKGRRVRYLHPIRLYVFTSAIFFLLFFTYFVSGESIMTNVDRPATIEERNNYISKLEASLKKDAKNIWLKERIAFAKDTTHQLMSTDLVKTSKTNSLQISFSENDFKTLAAYDSAQQLKPANERGGWIDRRLKMIEIRMNQKIAENPKEAVKKFVEIVLHRLPYMLLISLPFFALILKLVYWRRKQFYYADHGVFTIHLYVFTFLILLLIFALQKAENKFHWSFAGTIATGVLFLLFFYMYAAMLRFYEQSKLKTFLKFILVNLLALAMMLILFIIIIFFSAATF